MSSGRFGVIQRLANHACLRIDQRHNRALPEGRRDFELRLAAARERGKASLVGGPADAVERDAGSLFGVGGWGVLRPGERGKKNGPESDQGARQMDLRAAPALAKGSSRQKAPAKAPPSIRM